MTSCGVLICLSYTLIISCPCIYVCSSRSEGYKDNMNDIPQSDGTIIGTKPGTREHKQTLYSTKPKTLVPHELEPTQHSPRTRCTTLTPHLCTNTRGPKHLWIEQKIEK